jgi:hypothetical protein
MTNSNICVTSLLFQLDERRSIEAQSRPQDQATFLLHLRVSCGSVARLSLARVCSWFD